MSNKYLEKISGFIGSSLKAVGGVAKDIAKDVGKSVMTAGGAGFRNEAARLNPGLSQKSLRGAGNIRGFLKATNGVLKNKADRRATVEGLRAERNKGIVKTLGYGGAAVYGGNKILNKLNENNSQQYYY